MTKLRASATIRIDISGQLTNIEAVSVSMRAKHNSIMHKTNGIHAMLVGYNVTLVTQTSTELD